jgi:hypothetical protein
MPEAKEQPAAGDRRSTQSGIKSGGRRKSDRRLVNVGKKGRLWIAISFGVSACVLAWAFSLPFRGNQALVSFGAAEDHSDPLDVSPVSRSRRITANEDYVQSMLQLDRELKMQLAAKNASPKQLAGKPEARNHWRKQLKRRVEDVKLLTESAAGEIRKGTIEWHAQQELREFLNDAPQP